MLVTVSEFNTYIILIACLVMHTWVSEVAAEELPGWHEKLYETQSAAKQAKARLDARGAIHSSIEERQEVVPLTQLRMGPFSQILQAQKVQQKLAQQGVDTQIFGNRQLGELWISLGIFKNPDYLKRTKNKVESLGYEVFTQPFETQQIRYLVKWQWGDRVVEQDQTNQKIEPNSDIPTPPGVPFAPIEIKNEVYTELGRSTAEHETYPNYLRIRSELNWPLAQNWKIRLGARADAYLLSAVNETKEHKILLDEAFLRYSNSFARLTLGSQTVIWGQADEFSPLDLLSRQDVRRGWIDELAERRLATPAVRVEWFIGTAKLDFLYMPKALSPLTAERDQFWTLISPMRGELLGFSDDPILSTLVNRGSLSIEKEELESGGIRLTHSFRAMDWGISYLETQNPVPYYVISPTVVQNLNLSNNDVDLALAASNGPTFFEVHPKIRATGLEFSWDMGLSLLRIELVKLQDVPVTGLDLAILESEQLNWIVDMEFYPGDRDARINIQFTGNRKTAEAPFLDDNESYTLNGQVEYAFAHDRIRFQLRSRVGLSEEEYYLSPKLIFRNFEPLELTVAYHAFDGEAQTVGGFFDSRDYIALGGKLTF